MVLDNDYPSEQLSKDFFKNALENGFQLKELNNNNNNKNNNCICIENIKISIGSSGGDNYCSKIYRALIEYKILINNLNKNNCNNNNNDNDTKNNCNNCLKQISLIVKYMPNNEHLKLLDDMGFYNKEIIMFTEIMPRIENLLKNCEIFAPKLFYATKQPARTIVLQDLKALGYELADRLEGLDEKHSKILLRKLGQYHAATMVLAKKHPELMKHFNKGFFQESNMQSELFESIFIKNLQHIINIISEWENYDTIAEKLKNLIKNFRKRAVENIKPKDGDVRVLNHGDLWVNNFMFKYDDNNEPYEVTFIDLQISNYSGLGLDINYFLNTSVKIDLLKMKRYELLHYYYNAFKMTLKQLNYDKIPTWNDVKNEINDKEFFGFVAFEAILPLIAMDREKSKNNNFDTLVDENVSKERREIMFSSNRMIETIKYSLNRFDELGLFD